MMVPVLIGVAALLLGGAALFFSLGGADQADNTQGALEAMTAKAEGLETRLRDLEEKYQAMDSELKAAKGDLNRMASDINTEFKEVGVEINRNRDLIETSADKLTELIDTLNRQGRPSAANASEPTPPPPPSAPAAPAAPVVVGSQSNNNLPVANDPETDPTLGPVVIGAENRTHTIRSGDTFTKLSQQYNVSVAAILGANPDVDPRRLAVGQKIKIPAK